MIRKTFGELFRMVGGIDAQNGEESLLIQGVSTDSRKIEKGNLYIPLRGERFDGHDFVREAVEKGAAAALWQKDSPLPPADIPLIMVDHTLAALQRLASCYREQLHVKIVGVTGSNGKTTTKDMIASVLGMNYNVQKTLGNLNNHIGLPLTILNLKEDTEIAVLEMGMSGRGEIERLSRIARPDVAVITNIGEAHLMQLGSREEIAKAKWEIASGLKKDGLMVINGDEPLLEQQLRLSGDVPFSVFRFGLSRTNDFFPTGMMQDGEGIYFTLHGDDPEAPAYYIPLLGRHNVINALAAIAVGTYFGMEPANIARGLKVLKLTGMRTERLQSQKGFTVFNDAYNASPSSVKAAIELLKELKGYERKILVLGDMLELGERETDYHREIGGALSPEFFDYIFTYGPLAAHIAMEAEKKFPPGKVRAFLDKDELTEALKRLVQPNDVVLVKGSRGMKLEDVVAALT